jgi:hypothetical protein
MSDKIKGNVRVYCAGGLGANLASILLRDTKQPAADGFANLDVCLIDTSKSNLIDSAVPEANRYLVEDRDGSGGVRSENAEAIIERKLEVLQKFKPSDDLNIVISSGGGGSGSVIAPVLVGELLNRGLNVIVLMVGSQETVTEANNTLKTLMSYEGVWKATGQPVVISYTENDAKNSHKDNDELIVQRVTALRVLFSRENHGLDSMDLTNWLHFNKVTSFQNSGIAGLSIADKATDMGDGKGILSVATLSADVETSSLPYLVEYQRKGLTKLKDKIDGLPIHYLISDGFLADRVSRIEKTLNDFDANRDARVKTGPLFNRKGEKGEGGLVF